MAREIKIEFRIPGFNESLTFAKNILLLILNFVKKMSWQYGTAALAFLLHIYKYIVADIKNKKWQGLIVVLFTIVAFLLWGISSALLWLLFLIFLVYGWENRVLAVLALICLVLCPFLLLFNKETWAEPMAVYAFFFLVMTLILQLIDYRFGEYLKSKNLW